MLKGSKTENGYTAQREMYFAKAMSLHFTDGLSSRKISQIIPVSYMTIERWIAKFAGEKEKKPAMPRRTPENNPVPAPDIISGGVKQDTPENMAAEIARLQKELRNEKMRAEAYNEMINIAEERFKISIRKKSGAKQ